MYKVQITNRTSGQTFLSGSLTVAEAPYGVVEARYFDAAWKAAVEDGLVDSTRRADYEFELLTADAA